MSNKSAVSLMLRLLNRNNNVVSAYPLIKQIELYLKSEEDDSDESSKMVHNRRLVSSTLSLQIDWRTVKMPLLM